MTARPLIVLVDQDGVLADFEKAFHDQFLRTFPSIPSIPANEREQFYVSSDYLKRYPNINKNLLFGISRKKGFFLNLPPIKGAINAVQEMVEMGIDVRICTTPITDYDHCVVEKYQWVEKHLGKEFTSRLILTRDKTLIFGDVLIDDRPSIQGILTPQWKHILFDAPYNQHVKSVRLNDWRQWKEVVLPQVREETNISHS
jgi:5'-nucleotidase